MARGINFKNYSFAEIMGILKERAKLALRADTIAPELLKQIANITFTKGDIRIGLFMLREAAKNAEQKGKNKISEEDIKKVIFHMGTSKIMDEEKLNLDETKILEAVKEKNGAISGELFELYEKKDGGLSYRSFKRYLIRMAKHGLIELKKTTGGFKGKSTQVFIKK
jgi:Cdc6-like AAA superfamily ATPase